MSSEPVKKIVYLPGPILSLTLIGLLILSAVLYYRAQRAQRFLEPALAISQPRIKFAQNINNLLIGEFTEREIRGITFKAGSLLVDRSLLFASAHHVKGSEPLVIEKLSRIFFTLLSNPDMREDISLILVVTRSPLARNSQSNITKRLEAQKNAEIILNSLYGVAPSLERNYSKYFAATVVPTDSPEKDTLWIEFRFVPTERFHIEVLKSLGKYAP